jgi:hypothetical protein
MKRISFALTIVAGLTLCGVAFAQNAAEEENPAIQELKVLEPLVGTYHASRTNEETGRVREIRRTISWSDTKTMLTSEAIGREAESEADLANQEWQPWGYRAYYVWNHDASRIELITVMPGPGVVNVSEIKREDENVFTHSRIRTTGNPAWRSAVKVIVTEEGITYQLTNRKNAAGETLEDAEYEMKRM